MQVYLRSLESRLPADLKSALGTLGWAGRIRPPEEQNHRLKVPFISDGLTLSHKTAVEEFITTALRREFPKLTEVVVFFERQQPSTNAPTAPQPEPHLSRTTHPQPPQPQRAEGIKHVILVGSGKGGVGKSTVSTNLAVALAELGHKVGILDADVYGPNIPLMLGIQGNDLHVENGKVTPPQGHGVKCMSMGLLAPEDSAIIWRGPMITKFLRQMFEDIAWGELDFLLIDLPPGTGDTQISLVQQVVVAGAVVVTTPQTVALQDSQKAIAMFEKTNIPVFGVVENMSGYICPHCGGESHIFGHGGGESMADRNHVPFLARIPLVGKIREGGDSGRPVAAQADSPIRMHFLEVAQKIANHL
jgi:ATP-binding protein involved in chromosome partitioning